MSREIPRATAEEKAIATAEDMILSRLKFEYLQGRISVIKITGVKKVEKTRTMYDVTASVGIDGLDRIYTCRVQVQEKRTSKGIACSIIK